MEELTGRQFGSYRVVAALGQGGMAAIYKAFQPAVNRHVALKILSHHFTSDPEFFQRFRHEAAILAQLQHPHILPIFDFGEADGYAFLAMPFIDAGTLAGLLKGVPVALDIVERVMSQVGDALDYAHSKGIVHRDIKPSNILMDARGNCLVADFGIARMAEGATRLTMTGTIMGTPEYMSPEQALGEQAGPASDIYSLGIVLYEMLTGRVPFRADTPIAVAVKHINAPLPPPRTLNASLTPEVEAVVEKALARSPGDRFESATAFSKALTAAVRAPRETSPLETREAPPMETIVRRPTDRLPVEPQRATPTPQAPTAATVVKPPTAAPLVKPPTGDVPVRRRKRIVYVSVALVLGVLALAAYLVSGRGNGDTAIALPAGCEADEADPDISADGRYVALMVSCESGDSLEYRTILADRMTGNLKSLGPASPDAIALIMTPDGRYTFFWQRDLPERTTRIVRYDRQSDRSVTIDLSEVDLSETYMLGQRLSVSDDGRYLVTEGRTAEQGAGAYVADIESGALTRLTPCDRCRAKISPDGQWLAWEIEPTLHVSNRISGRVSHHRFTGHISWAFGRHSNSEEDPVVYIRTGEDAASQVHQYHPVSEQLVLMGALAGVDSLHAATDGRSIMFNRFADPYRLFLLELDAEKIHSLGPTDGNPSSFSGSTNHMVCSVWDAQTKKFSVHAFDR